MTRIWRNKNPVAICVQFEKKKVYITKLKNSVIELERESIVRSPTYLYVTKSMARIY